MTTIATDGKTMAADSLQCGNHIDQLSAKKIFRIGGVVYGISGSLESAAIYVEWVKAGRAKKDTPTLQDDFCVLFVRNGVPFFESHKLIPVHTGCPATIGSGGTAAMGAMLAGASPKKAVIIAAKLNIETGGAIRIMKC